MGRRGRQQKLRRGLRHRRSRWDKTESVEAELKEAETDSPDSRIHRQRGHPARDSAAKELPMG